MAAETEGNTKSGTYSSRPPLHACAYECVVLGSFALTS